MTRGNRPTIRDVAQAAGVSVATVSNVVNGHAHVTERTRTKVLDAIEQLGYKASRAARSLPAGRTFMLAYCLPDDEAPNPALDVFLHRMVATASAADLEVLLFGERRGDDRVRPYRDMLRRGGADGFVLSGIEYGDERVTFLRERNIPFACFGRVEDETVSSIDVDGAAGLARAVEHVHELGHERIAFVGWPEGSATGDDRCRGYEQAMDAAGLPHIITRTLNDFDHARKLVPVLLEEQAPTAILCVSDQIALGVMAGIRDVGKEPGADIAVTGFDDTPAADLTAPALTSLRQPMDRVGTRLVESLIDQLTGRGEPVKALIEPDLIIRQSTTGTHTSASADGPMSTQEG